MFSIYVFICMYTLGSGTGLGQPGYFSSGTGTGGGGGGGTNGSGGSAQAGVAAVGVEYALSQQLSEAIRVNLPSLVLYICIHVYNMNV